MSNVHESLARESFFFMYYDTSLRMVIFNFRHREVARRNAEYGIHKQIEAISCISFDDYCFYAKIILYSDKPIM